APLVGGGPGGDDVVGQGSRCLLGVSHTEAHPRRKVRAGVRVEVGVGGALETGLNVDPGGAGHAHEVDQRVDVDEFGSLLQQHVQVGQPAVLLPVLQATGSEVVGAGPHGALQRGQQCPGVLHGVGGPQDRAGHRTERLAALGEVNREYHGVAPGGDLDQLQLAVDRLTTTGHADGQGVVVEQVVGELDTVFVDPQRDRGVGDGDPDLIGGQLAPLDGVAQHVAPDDGD